MKKQSKKQSKKPSKKLSERAKRLKELLVMMEREPQEFAQEALCDPRLLNKLLPEGCDEAIATDPSPRTRTTTTLRFKVLEYIANDILTQDQDAILGASFLWEKYLDRLEIGQYRRIGLKSVVNFWCEKGSLIKFMDDLMKKYLESNQKKELIRSFQEFNTPGNGITLLLDCVQPNAVQPRDNQVRNFDNFLNAIVERLALEIERSSLEILGFSALATSKVVHPKTLTPGSDFMDHLRDLVRMVCTDRSPDCGIEMIDKAVTYRTIESDSGVFRPDRTDGLGRFRNASGVLISPPHTGKTTYVKMLALKNVEPRTDCIAVYINAVDLKTYALLKRSVSEFLADQLIKRGLAGEEDFETVVTALQNAERTGKIIFFIDDPEALNLDEERAIILQFALCKQVFFVTTPWATETVKGLMAEYGPGREIKTYSMSKLSLAERDEIVGRLEQQYPGFQEAANKFLAHTYSSLFEQPIGLMALADEYQRTGDNLSELFTTQRIFNSLLVKNGLDYYQINFTALSLRNYRMWFLSHATANCIQSEIQTIQMGREPELFWSDYTLTDVFSLDKVANEAFVRAFLEPDPHNPHLVRFFFKDFHYLLTAIDYVLLNVWEGRSTDSYSDLNTSCIPKENRSPNLDPNSIIRLYLVDLLTYINRHEAEAGARWKL